jgi:hypothetical protein
VNGPFTKKFKRVSFDWKELDHHSAEDRAVFAFACFAVSEINSLRNILLLALHKVTDDNSIDGFVSVQRNMLTRLLSSKLWEFAKAVKGNASSRQGISHEVKAVVVEARKAISKSESKPGWKIARTLRDKSAFHCDIGAISRNIRSGVDDFEADFLIAEEDGNCLFRLGEVVANSGNKSDDFDDLLDWVQEMWGISVYFHLAVLNKLLPREFYSNRERTEEIFFPNDLVFSSATRLPIIGRHP